jgi:hypothetical protein
MKPGNLLLILLFTFLGRSAEGPSPIPSLQEKAMPAVVSLYSARPGSEQATSRGVGFLVSSNGILVTARHVSEANSELVAFTADGRKHQVTGFYDEDRDYDVAVLKIDGQGFPFLPIASGPLPQTNEWVAVVSPEPDRTTVYSTGSVKVVLSVPNVWEVIGTTLPAHPGQSGSPLLNSSGEAAGIVCGNDNRAEDGYAGYAMPISIVPEILARKQSPIPFEKRPRKGSSLPLAFDKDFRSAAEAMGHNNWAEAETALKRAARRFPESPLVLFCLGLCQAKRQAWKQAESSMEEVVKLKPGSGLAWCVYGASLAARGRHSESEVALRTCIRLQPPDQNLLFTAWELIARIDAERGNTNGVREALANLRSLDPSKAELCCRELQHQYPKLGLPDAPER